MEGAPPSDDPAWDFVLNKEGNKLRCKFCNQLISGGITRLKWHLAHSSGDVKACLAVDSPVKENMRKMLDEAKLKKTAVVSRERRTRGKSNDLERNTNVDDKPLDKRRKTDTAMERQASTGHGQPPLVPVNKQKDQTENDGDLGGSEEFTKEKVEELLKEKFNGKMYDSRAKTDHIERLRLCVKWFQGVEEKHIEEGEKIRNMLESSERKCTQTELTMKNKEEELDGIISELKIKNAKEVSAKLEAIDSHTSEKEARIAAEKLNDSLREELGRAEQEKLSANQTVATLNDLYTRLQDCNTNLQQDNSKLQSELASANESLKRVDMEKAAIVANLASLRNHYNSLQEQLTSYKASQDEAMKVKEELAKEVGCLRGELQQVREDRDRQIANVHALNSEIALYKESSGRSIADLDNLTIKSNVMEETCSSLREQIRILQHQLDAANEKFKMIDLSALETRVAFEKQKQVVDELQERLAEAELQNIEGEKLRKKLHNTILELKGNIRVFCRVRPLLPDDNAGTEGTVISYPTSMESQDRGIDLMKSGQKFPFTFDKVFTHEASQHDVFVEISQLVQSALDGYKVCIFAYGQTGSGKTYTMMGRPEAPEQKGLIPRSLEQIFQTSQSLMAKGWKYKMQASMLEIYNETIRDLLSVNRSRGLDVTRAEHGGQGKQYAIKQDSNGNTYVSDLTIIDVCSITEVSSLLRQAAQSRSVGKTHMNEQSSRSHFVFTLRISGVNEGTEQQVQGVLNLIDLAGSERLSRSGATGDRLKETQAINKSLSSLSDVIFALAKKEAHVPFRNSKLTYLLQPCLGGDSKTLMVVNISPDQPSVDESLCSLRFAARVNSCEIGVPRR